MAVNNEVLNLLARFTDRQRAMRRQSQINQAKAQGYDTTAEQDELDYFNDLRNMRDADAWLRNS